MYSWKTIRSIAAILMLIPVLHLTVLISSEVAAVIDTSPTAWADEVEAYTATDRLTPLTKDPIVIVGGRQVLLWRDVENILAPRTVLMRGLGDATVDDISYYYDKLIGFYDPKTVVLLPGITEFHLRDNKSADELVAAIRDLVEMDLETRPAGQFYVFTPLHSILYPDDKEKVREVTRQLNVWAASRERVSILDANRLLSDEHGAIRPTYYRSDGVNLNELGQSRLTMLLLAQLEHDSANAVEQL